ncbi:hypothetical protein [Labilibacter marinus]|uniref:hypothetical protein n=1 Tax=Labilibacter marinus TaxID=1477105 RepID=UPI00094FECCE|nr:hypothetical protein [Labilibacter marinus]
MIRILIILVFIQGFLVDLKSQSDFQNRHIYELIRDYYYLDIMPDSRYSLKVGMYLDRYVKGDYKINGDTLELIGFDFIETEYNLSENDKAFVKKGLSRFIIKDSLLFPIAYRDLAIPSRTMQRDSMIIREYMQNDGHVHFKLTFRADLTFRFSTSSDMDRHSTSGRWKQNNNMIQLIPDNSDNLLHWICTDYQLTMIENYLVGKTVDENDKVVEYQYLFGLKPTANK